MLGLLTFQVVLLAWTLPGLWLQAWDFAKIRRTGVVRSPVWTCSEMISHRCGITHMLYVPALEWYPKEVPHVRNRKAKMTKEDIAAEKAG